MSFFRLALPLAALSLASCAAPQVRGSGTPARTSGRPTTGSSERRNARYDAPPSTVHRSAILVGQRRLDEDIWEPLENQLLFGVEFSSVGASSNMGFEIGFTGSFDDIEDFGGDELDMRIFEAYGGLRLQQAGGRARPFIGAGASLVYAELESNLTDASVDDAALGGYIHAGMNFEITRDLDLVFDVRKRIGSDLVFSGLEADIDFLTFAVGLSF